MKIIIHFISVIQNGSRHAIIFRYPTCFLSRSTFFSLSPTLNFQLRSLAGQKYPGHFPRSFSPVIFPGHFPRSFSPVIFPGHLPWSFFSPTPVIFQLRSFSTPVILILQPPSFTNHRQSFTRFGGDVGYTLRGSTQYTMNRVNSPAISTRTRSNEPPKISSKT